MLIFFTLVLGFGGSRTPINACQVLSARDVAAVQGARFKSTKLKESGNREMQVSQCFYAMPRLSDSISVDLIRGDTRGFWKKHFADVRDELLASTTPHHERAAQAIRGAGLGDAAVCSDNGLAGALYAMKGEPLVRDRAGL